MSTQSVTNNGQQAKINTDRSKVFLWNRRSAKGQITNGTGAPITILEGTVMGRIGATNLLVAFTSAAVDGSQHPIGVLMTDYTIAAGATADVFICDAGDVAAEKLLFQGADTLETVISGRRVKDLLQMNAPGLKLVYSTELTNFDN
jgi:hypothetical protein